MKTILVAAVLLAAASAASGQELTETQARAVIAPWYGGEVSGTPSGELFGVPHGGRSFRIMAIDIQTIRDGKMVQTYHLENWLSALGQLRAKQP